MTTTYTVVEINDENGELIGFGVCAVTQDTETKRRNYFMLPAVYGAYSEARTAALNARDLHAAHQADLDR